MRLRSFGCTKEEIIITGHPVRNQKHVFGSANRKEILVRSNVRTTEIVTENVKAGTTWSEKSESFLLFIQRMLLFVWHVTEMWRVRHPQFVG